jgi:hypothetical protein
MFRLNGRNKETKRPGPAEGYSQVKAGRKYSQVNVLLLLFKQEGILSR